MEFSAINSVILGIVVLILLLIFVNTSRSGMQDLADKQICKKSVEANSWFRFGGVSANTDINCPTKFIKVSSSSENVVFETLALALSDTWDEFLEGKEEIFPTATQDYCVIRRVVEFKEAETYDGFFDYLLQHNPPSINKPYFTYLTNIDVNKGLSDYKLNIKLKKDDKIDTSNKYAVVFVMAKKENIGKVLGAKIGAVSGGTVGVIAAGAITYFTGGLGAATTTTIFLGSVQGGTLIGAAAGYLLGSNYPANWDSAILLVPYTEEGLKKLNCSMLPVSLSETQK